MKKVISALLSAVVLTGCVAGLAACDKEEDPGADAKYRYSITVWVGEDTSALTKELIGKFNKENTLSIWFDATVNEVTESKAAGDVIAKPGDAPEMFCFAQDQIARLVSSNLLYTPASSFTLAMTKEHTETSVAAATVGTSVCAFPLTQDNGYFLYYDKSIISEEQADSIEAIVKACEDNNRFFSFNLDEGWYSASFFYGAGAKSEWEVDNQGRFTKHDDTFNSEEGYLAAQGMQTVLKSKRYLANGKASDFNASTPAGAVISGVWDYNTAKNALKENLGIAKLPTFTATGTNGEKVTKRLQSYMGCKLLGISKTEGEKGAALSFLAQYLTNKDAQLERFKAFGWGPTIKELQDNAEVKSSAALNVLKETATVAQGQYPANWAAKMKTLSGTIKGAETDAVLKTALSTYESELDELLTQITA